jgi:hypothetical protein
VTLVVARVTPLGVRLASDMRITGEGAAHPAGFVNAALKIVLIRPTLAVGYAGNVAVAIPAIREAANEALDLEDAVARLAGDRHTKRADYVVASVHPAKLVEIRDGNAEERSSAWIGDPDAFALYQREYLRERWSPPPEFYLSVAQAGDMAVAGRMSDAMEAVVHGPHFETRGEEEVLVRPEGGLIPSVGEAVVSAVPRVEDGFFKYAEMNRAASSRFQQPLPPGLGVVPPDWGSAERGAFSYSMLTPRAPGVGAIGLYFYEGHLGVLYAPLILDEPQRFPGIGPNAFIELVRIRYGITLQGFIGEGS